MTPGSTATYSISVPPGNFIYWSIVNGTINGQQNLLTNSTSVTVVWGASGTSSSVNFSRFTSWPPSGAPTHYGYKNVSVQVVNPPVTPAPGTCAYLQYNIDQTYANVSPSQKCAAVIATYNGIVQGFPNLATCSVNLYGCR